MSKKLLDKFFKEHSINSESPTAPALAHFHLKMENDSEAGTKIYNMLNNVVYEAQPGREEETLTEREEIESADTCEEIIRFMRRHTDPMNQHILVNKAMEFENEIVPEIVKKLRTSLNDGFVETSIRILAKSDYDIDEIIGYYDRIRSPYTQSMVLVMLGFKLDETHILWLIEKYNELKKLYPHESYCEGAYYALYEIDSRFYQ